MHLSDCSCAPILQFFDAALDDATANSQIPDRIFGHFLPVWGRIASPIMHRFGCCFHLLLKRIWCALQRSKRFVVPSVGGATRFANLWRKYSKTQKIGSRVVPNTSYSYRYYLHCNNLLHSRIAAYTRDNILPVLHCLRGDAFVSS